MTVGCLMTARSLRRPLHRAQTVASTPNVRFNKSAQSMRVPGAGVGSCETTAGFVGGACAGASTSQLGDGWVA